MGFDNARIVLDSPNNTYYAGQTVNGRLIFSRDRVKNFRGIYVHMRGYCKVHWTSRERNMNNTGEHDKYRTITHESYEDYFDQKIYLYGSSSGDHQLPPGRHEFGFSIRIPDNCPSAFEGDYGHVRYELRCVVDRAFKTDQELTSPIKILSPLDLNMVPNAREPIQMKIEESYCCWCMNAGSSETLVKLPASGFCPGQVIPIELSCINRTSDEINLKLAIKKETTFRARQSPGTQHARATILEEKRGPVPPHVTKNWTVEVIVPEMEVHNMKNCSFIDIEYELKVTVSPGSCHNDSEDSCNLIFGTIPLGATQPFHNPQIVAPNQAYQPAITSQPVGSPYPNPGYPNGNQYPSPNPYPGAVSNNTPYPTNTPYPNPATTSPYPTTTSPYPATTSPYPATTSPYPTTTSPYPATTSPYPTTTSPYPTTTSPYPNNPYPPAPQNVGYQNSPNPTPYPPNPNQSSPYPPNQPSLSPYPPSPPQGGENPPYPMTPPGATGPPSGRTSPYPQAPYTGTPVSMGLKTGTFGFMHGDDKGGASIPLLPEGASVPMPKPSPPNPYAASAPVPSTPDDVNKPLMAGGTSGESQPAFNPAFANQTHN